jgi:hypothetical protein
VDGNGIRDDSDELEGFSNILRQPSDEMSIDGECQYDDLRVMGIDKLPDPEVGKLMNKDGFFDQGEVMADDIEEVPSPGITVDQS